MSSATDRLGFVAQVTASYLRRNPASVEQITPIVRKITAALEEADQTLRRGAFPAGVADSGATNISVEDGASAPAVPVEQSVHPDYLICLEDGERLRRLKRHLLSAHGMTPEQYKAKWNLPGDYPMTAERSGERTAEKVRRTGSKPKGRSDNAWNVTKGTQTRGDEIPASPAPDLATAGSKPRRGRPRKTSQAVKRARKQS